MRERRVVVVGGGPAGLAAAVFAARAGAAVVLLEKNDCCGRKLLVTGGGRANVSNTRPPAEWPALFGRRGRFIVPALAVMPRERLEEWLAGLGQPVHCPDGRHLFPRSESARALRDALVDEARRLGVDFVTGATARRLAVEDGVVGGVFYERGDGGDGRLELAVGEAVVLATGGKSYPKTGSTWDIGGILSGTGHAVEEPIPGLVGLRADNLDPDLAGLVLPEASVTFLRKGGAVATFRRKGGPALVGRGEMLLTHGGVSGPAVLDLSADVAEAMAKAGPVVLRVAWLAGADAGVWLHRFADWRKNRGAASIKTLLRESVPNRLAVWLCACSGVGPETPAARLTSGEADALSGNLGAFPARITESEGWDRAMITRGGVRLSDVRPDTLESRLVRGLHFAGEALDLDGPCGGYNLHWAFASGALAGGNSMNN